MLPINPLTIKLAIAAFLLAGSYYLGYSLEHAKFMLFVTQVEEQGKIQEEKNKAIIKESSKVNERIASDYQKNLNALRNSYADRLLDNSSSSGGVPKVSSSTKGIDGKATYSVTIGQCAETTLMLVSLQDWIKQQSEAYK